MAISINPVLPVLSAQEAGGLAPELVLQPGSVVSAQVLKVLSADLVRIAIASLSIDVASEIPLQQGQNLQLAVMQTKDGIRLAVVGQGGDAQADAVTLSPDALAEAAINRPAIVSPKNVLTPLERVAVSTAAQAAVTGFLIPLCADFSRLPNFVETTHGVSAGAFMAATISSSAALYSPVASSKCAFGFPEAVFGGRAGSIASQSNRTR